MTPDTPATETHAPAAAEAIGEADADETKPHDPDAVAEAVGEAVAPPTHRLTEALVEALAERVREEREAAERDPAQSFAALLEAAREEILAERVSFYPNPRVYIRGGVTL